MVEKMFLNERFFNRLPMVLLYLGCITPSFCFAGLSQWDIALRSGKILEFVYYPPFQGGDLHTLLFTLDTKGFKKVAFEYGECPRRAGSISETDFIQSGGRHAHTEWECHRERSHGLNSYQVLEISYGNSDFEEETGYSQLDWIKLSQALFSYTKQLPLKTFSAKDISCIKPDSDQALNEADCAWAIRERTLAFRDGVAMPWVIRIRHESGSEGYLLELKIARISGQLHRGWYKFWNKGKNDLAVWEEDSNEHLKFIFKGKTTRSLLDQISEKLS